MYTKLKEIERFARANGSRKTKACKKWVIWAEKWINENDHIITSIDNYHHCRRVIKGQGKKCIAAIAGGNCVTIFFE